MAPITQVGLVFLTTASLTLASRHQARGQRHMHKRSQQYVPGPYGYNNGTTSASGASAGPTGTAVTTSTPDITLTRTETLISTITDYVTEEGPGAAYPTGESGATVSGAAASESGASAPTCGGNVYVTVTDTVTVTAGDETVSASSPGAAYQPPTTTSVVTSAAATSSQVAMTTSSTSTFSAPAYSAPAYSAPASSAAASSVPPAYSAPAYTAPAYSAPASKATTTVAPAPTGSSGGGLKTKRGCLYSLENGGSINECSLLCGQDNSVSWAINWDSTPSYGADTADYTHGFTFLPQLWSDKSADGSHDFTVGWDTSVATALKNGATAVLGMNEPDNAGQANLTPSHAATVWNQYIAPYKGQATLVSPSVTSVDQNNVRTGLVWLQNFQSQGVEWDATGVHFYSDCADAALQAQALDDFVNAAYTQFNKPVWVTEFGCNAGTSSENFSAFLAAAIAKLESNSNCHQYAAFQASLLVGSSGPNSVGQVYVSTPSS